MKKNRGDEIQPVQIDPINGHYYIIIPEWIANELSWYEDTEVKFSIEGGELILNEPASN